MKHQINVSERVCLPSKGLNERRATTHKYSHSEIITIAPRTKDERPITGLGHFYTCQETGEVRQYGFDATWNKDITSLQGN